MKIFNPVLMITTFLMLIFGCTACKKSLIDQLGLLPPVTDTGANTFGCLVDGVAMISRAGKPSYGLTIGAVYPTWIPAITISIEYGIRIQTGLTDANSPSTYIEMHVNDPYKMGATTYVWEKYDWFSTFRPSPYRCQIYGGFISPKTKKYEWFGSYENSGKIEITRFDSTKRIVSAIFNGKVIGRYDVTDTVVITNGRFDGKF